MSLVYVIEDEENIRNLLTVALEGFGYQVKAFETAEHGLQDMKEEIPDAAIFDIMLPGIDGLSAVRLVRQDKRLKKLPVLVLTARDKEIDKVQGLDCGADDYMTKPFSILELGARLRSLLRRVKEEEQEPALSCAGLSVNLLTREVRFEGAEVELTLKEFELLKYILSNKQRIVSRDELLNQVWGYEFTGESRTLDIHIRTLRQKLGEKAAQYIRTVRGVGYRFVVAEEPTLSL